MRLSGDPSDIMAQSVKQRTASQLREIYPRQSERAAAFTQAIMELGQQVCIPNGTPHCDACPLGLFCTARTQGLTDSIPYRSPKKPRRIEQRTVLIPIRTVRQPDGQLAPLYGLRRRPPQGLLSGLWEFPSVDGHLPDEEVKTALQSLYGGLDVLSITAAPSSVHIFTHIEWHMIGYCVDCRLAFEADDPSLVWATAQELRTTYAVPTAYRAYVEHLLRQNQ
jgi:A/G-specific adenine glycosylase